MIDLSKFGGQALKHCQVKFHRPLPPNAQICQIAISGRKSHRHLVVSFTVPSASVAKHFPATGLTAGIDPGLKTAFTLVPGNSKDYGTSDHQDINPPLFRDVHFRKLLARLNRKLDRQRRFNNPDCYDSKGMSIKGKYPWRKSKAMQVVEAKIAKMNRHMANARLDCYHKTWQNILTSYDKVAIGNWDFKKTTAKKKSTPAKRGLGAARRAINRKGYDIAKSIFISIGQDKAKRSTVAKDVRVVNERNSTRDCPHCHLPTGPTGYKDLKIRYWTCSNCGTKVLRDASSAWQIAQKISAADATSVSPAGSARKSRKTKHQRTNEVKNRSNSIVPVADEVVAARSINVPEILDGTRNPLVASSEDLVQRLERTRASQDAASKDIAQALPLFDQQIHSSTMAHSQSAAEVVLP